MFFGSSPNSPSPDPHVSPQNDPMNGPVFPGPQSEPMSEFTESKNEPLNAAAVPGPQKEPNMDAPAVPGPPDGCPTRAQLELKAQAKWSGKRALPPPSFGCNICTPLFRPNNGSQNFAGNHQAQRGKKTLLHDRLSTLARFARLTCACCASIRIRLLRRSTKRLMPRFLGLLGAQTWNIYGGQHTH